MYKNTPRTIEQIKDAIRQEIQAVNVDLDLATHFHPVQRIKGVILLRPHITSWRKQGQL